MIGELQQRYPRNRLLWLEAGQHGAAGGTPRRGQSVARRRTRAAVARPAAAGPGEEARWRYAHGAALVALKDAPAAERELRAALAGATRDWVRGRVHKELGKLADLSGDRPRALDEYRLADRLCRQDHDSDCSDEVKRLMK